MVEIPHSSWGAPCKRPLRTVVTRGWSFDGNDRADVKVTVAAELAPLYAYLARSAVEGGYRLRTGQCWGFACRRVRGGSSWSGHAYAGAWDWNSVSNPMVARKSSGDFDSRVTDMPPWLVELCEAWGIEWGGRWSRTVDGMHYQAHNMPLHDVEENGRIATIYFLEGRWGLGPDGTPIAPGAIDPDGDDELNSSQNAALSEILRLTRTAAKGESSTLAKMMGKLASIEKRLDELEAKS